MFHTSVTAVTYLADLTDPTSDGILIRIVNFGLSGLAVVVALIGGWHAFSVWSASKGKSAVKELRDVVFGVLAVEAVIGGVTLLANYGSSLIPSFAGG